MFHHVRVKQLGIASLAPCDPPHACPVTLAFLQSQPAEPAVNGAHPSAAGNARISKADRINMGEPQGREEEGDMKLQIGW